MSMINLGGGEDLGLKEFSAEFRRDAIKWCKGKSWIWRLPFLLLFCYFLIRYWKNPEYTCILSPLTLGVHELGHFVFAFLGQFMGILGGSLLQLFAPLALAFNFYRQKDYFAIALSFGWLSTSLFDMARYVADARAMELPLVSPFGIDSVIHDWNFILNKIGLLRYDTSISFALKIFASIMMLICLLSGAWLLLKMAEKEKDEDRA
ncbi:MAG: hypothetical protein PHO70_03865 [Candidatus Omnitrophica bacterium]|nr:hypothetical protein [Candidatus Omnitrophota bacterium]